MEFWRVVYVVALLIALVRFIHLQYTCTKTSLTWIVLQILGVAYTALILLQILRGGAGKHMYDATYAELADFLVVSLSY